MELGSELGVEGEGANFARVLYVGKQPPSAHKSCQCCQDIKLELQQSSAVSLMETTLWIHRYLSMFICLITKHVRRTAPLDHG